MKKILSLLFCFIMLAAGSTVTSAAGKGGFVSTTKPASGGFSGPGPAVTSAKDAANMRDDARVVLRGNIVQHLGKDKYLFEDASGSIQVEIDDDKWQGQTVTPNDTVELHGEIDRDWNSVEVEVDRVVMLK